MKKLHTASPGLLAPLQGLWRWLMPTVIPNAAMGNVDRREFPAPEPARFVKQRPCTAMPLRAATRPLRIVRVLDHDESSSNTVGRMLISGRMADVCAELDRLVAREQTMH